MKDPAAKTRTRNERDHIVVVRRQVVGDFYVSPDGTGGNWLHEAVELMLTNGNLDQHIGAGESVTDSMEFEAFGHRFTLAVEPSNV